MVDGTALQPSQQATKIACSACRRIKVKCLPVSDEAPPTSKCKRCVRLNLECEYHPQRRNTRKQMPSASPSPLPSTSRASNQHHGRSESTVPSPSTNQHISKATSETRTFSGVKFDRLDIMTPATSTHVDGHSLPLLLKAKEANSTVAAKRVGDMGNVFFDKCPVELGLLRLQDAQFLLDEFMKHLNPLIKLFDPKLHALTFLRSSSTPLFSAIMTASAKYFLPGAFRQLLAHSNDIIGQGFVRGVGDIGFLQAICVLVFWKESDDPTAFFKVGYAMRLAQALVLNEQRSKPLPEDETEARLILNRERTWRNLIAFDHTYRLSYGADGNGMHSARTSTRSIEIERWIEDSRPFGVPGDELLSYNMTLNRIFGVCDDLEETNSNASILLLDSLAKSELDALQRVFLDRLPESCPAETPGENYVRFAVIRGRCRLNKALLLKHGVEDKFAVVDYLSAVADYVKCAVELAQVGHMRFIQDTFAVGLFKLAEFLAQLFPHLSTEQQQLVLSWLTRIHDACREAKQDSETIAAAYVERFYKLVIKSLHPSFDEVAIGQSVEPSHEALPGMHARTAPTDPELAVDSQPAPSSSSAPAATDLFDFNTPSVDAAYWSSLFPDLDANQWTAWFNEISGMPIIE
ncbi:hypothetical protein ACM66B_003502 [Microbotryomycetes sp. NB124-2]